MPRGSFIVIEGGEGAGKTSQLQALRSKLGEEIVFTREPGGSPYAEEIRDLILHSPHAKEADARSLLALFWAARADHLRATIVPALEAGKHVICDRFDASTFAYQLYGQEAKDLEQIFFQIRDVYLGQNTPDIYIFLDVDPREGLRRRTADTGKNNHFDDRDVDFHERMRQGFQVFLERVPSVSINANQSQTEVAADLIHEIDKHLTHLSP